MSLNKKTRHEILYACPDAGCRVSTFTKDDRCPLCFTFGVIVRQPLSKNLPGAPPDPRKRSFSDT